MPYRSDATLLSNAFFSPGNTRASPTSTNHSKCIAQQPAQPNLAPPNPAALPVNSAPKAAVPLGLHSLPPPPVLSLSVTMRVSFFGRGQPLSPPSQLF